MSASDTPRTTKDLLDNCQRELQRSFNREARAQAELKRRDERRDAGGYSRRPDAQAAWDLLRRDLTALRERLAAAEKGAVLLAAATAHRGCCGVEHDPANGKLHGYCVVCGVPWPCDTAKVFIDAAIGREGGK